jgi:hypothetical protein
MNSAARKYERTGSFKEVKDFSVFLGGGGVRGAAVLKYTYSRKAKFYVNIIGLK